MAVVSFSDLEVAIHQMTGEMKIVLSAEKRFPAGNYEYTPVSKRRLRALEADGHTVGRYHVENGMISRARLDNITVEFRARGILLLRVVDPFANPMWETIVWVNAHDLSYGCTMQQRFGKKLAYRMRGESWEEISRYGALTEERRTVDVARVPCHARAVIQSARDGSHPWAGYGAARLVASLVYSSGYCTV